MIGVLVLLFITYVTADPIYVDGDAIMNDGVILDPSGGTYVLSDNYGYPSQEGRQPIYLMPVRTQQQQYAAQPYAAQPYAAQPYATQPVYMRQQQPVYYQPQTIQYVQQRTVGTVQNQQGGQTQVYTPQQNEPIVVNPAPLIVRQASPPPIYVQPQKIFIQPQQQAQVYASNPQVYYANSNCQTPGGCAGNTNSAQLGQQVSSANIQFQPQYVQ